MKKICKALKAIGLICKNPFLLNAVLEHEQVKKEEVASRYSFVQGLPVLPIERVFTDQQQVISPYAYLSGSCMPIDIMLLKNLAKKLQVQHYFEIGTWRGESVANVAQVVPECTTLNLPREEILKILPSEEYADLHGFFSKQNSNIHQIWGNSINFDFTPYQHQCDMVFIDGDHHYEAVKADTIHAVDLLRDQHSIIVWHDYAMNPEMIRWSVFAGILDGLPQSMHHRLFHVSNTLCAIYLPESIQEIHVEGLKPLHIYEKPDHYFEIGLKVVKIEK